MQVMDFNMIHIMSDNLFFDTRTTDLGWGCAVHLGYTIALKANCNILLPRA